MVQSQQSRKDEQINNAEAENANLHYRSKSNCDHHAFELDDQVVTVSQNHTINGTITRQNSFVKNSPPKVTSNQLIIASANIKGEA